MVHSGMRPIKEKKKQKNTCVPFRDNTACDYLRSRRPWVIER